MTENENKNIDPIEETKDEQKDAISDFMNAEEPIDSIEKTVEDLRRKIEALNQEKEEKEDMTLNIPDFKATPEDEPQPDIADTAKKAIDDMKIKASAVTENETVAKTLAYLRNNAIKAVTFAKEKFDDFSSDPAVQQKINQAGSIAKDAAVNAKKSFDIATDKAKDLAEGAAKKVDDMISDDNKEKIRKTSDNISDGLKQTKKSIETFIEKPEVQESLNKAKDGVKDITKKSVDTIKDFIDKK